jgi:hypothetical protein
MGAITDLPMGVDDKTLIINFRGKEQWPLV